MRKAYYVACGLVYEMMFLAVPAHGERVCSDCDRCADRFSALALRDTHACVSSGQRFAAVAGTVLAAHLLADWLSLPLYIARLCDVEIQESGALSAADGLLVLMVMAVFAMGSLSVYAVSLGLTVRRRSKQAA
ncbi:MAG: hypothetical protein ACLSV6_05545 [Butyricicoccus sp.]